MKPVLTLKRVKVDVMRIAVDTGGTFTDLMVESNDGTLTMAKAPTTPNRPLDGVAAAIASAAEQLGLDLATLLARTTMFIYGTTHALNAVVTGKTAKTAFLTTSGHPDILVMREGGRPDAFDYRIATPAPYVPRSLTWEVPERIRADGSVALALDEARVAGIAAELRDVDVEAVAVCLLWANVNGAHEERVKELLSEHLPGIPVSISSEVSPAIREYRRASAAAIDASLKPSMTRHLKDLQAFLIDAGLSGRLLAVTSLGGVIDIADAAAMPIQMLNSGPAMAPVSGRFFAAQDDAAEFVIVADTGGTTFDVSLVRRGRIPVSRETKIESPTGFHITGYSSIDIKSVGAGGGSIAWVDSGGMLHVGPHSSGADPGPAAYGYGGQSATVTDACLALGYLDPDFFLGGRRKLDLEAARRVIDISVARPLQRTIEDAAAAILEIATENMVQAITDITLNQGVDPLAAVLIGGGGAAGLNSAWIARRLGVKRLLIPEFGAALSACGALMSDLTSQFRKTHFARTDRFDIAATNRVLADLRRRSMAFLDRAGIQGQVEFLVEARYPEQVWEIEVLLPFQTFADKEAVSQFENAFHAAHEELFGIRDDGSPVEIVNWSATASGRIRESSANFVSGSPFSERDSSKSKRKAYFGRTGFVEALVVRLDKLGTEQLVLGPAIVESPFTTIVVPPGSRAVKTRSGSIALTQEATP